MGGDSCSTGCEFESRHRILDGHYFTYIFVVKFVMCLKRRKKLKRVRGWHIFLKKSLTKQCQNRQTKYLSALIYDEIYLLNINVAKSLFNVDLQLNLT